MTKEKISTAVQAAIDGNASALEAYALIKQYEKDVTEFIAAAKKQVEEEAIKESEKYPSKTFEHQGFKFERRQGRAMYDYKEVSAWAKYKEKLASIESLAKLAAQSNQLGKSIFDEETGEIIEPCKVTFTKDVLIVKS
jgi:cell fate (sporulation/competence/biofilm development) regulator YlbF (YheA/YmcA/DUF963 family)